MNNHHVNLTSSSSIATDLQMEIDGQAEGNHCIFWVQMLKTELNTTALSE